jgi:hypothetical protein
VAFEYRLVFDDPYWLDSHREAIRERLRRRRTLVQQPNEREFWLRDPASEGTWEFDVRVFVQDSGIFLEISVQSDACMRDLRDLFAELRRDTTVHVVDADDGVPVEPREAFPIDEPESGQV